MPKENLIQEEVLTFAIQITGLARRLKTEKEYEMAAQQRRARTSTGPTRK